MAITAAMREEVSQLYVALFGRAPDGEGLGYWVQRRDAGLSVAQVANEMYATTPARTYYPSFATNSEIVTNFYVNVLGRQPDASGLTFWTGQLNSSTPGAVIASMINNVMNYGGTDAQGLVSAALFQNKAAVATAYGLANGSVAGATSILSTVTDAAATRTAALTSISNGTATGVGGSAGQTFTLTTGTDSGANFSGGNSNDNFNGVVGSTLGATDGTTFNPGDNLSGGGGTDSLNVSVSGTYAAADLTLAAFTLNGIERMMVANYQSADAFDTIFNMSNASGLTTIGINGSSASGDTQFTNVRNVVSAEMNSGAGDLSITYLDTAVSGTADTQNLGLNGVTAGTFTAAPTTAGGNGIETLAITSSGGTRNVLTQITNQTGLATITVAGDTAVTLGTLGAAITSVNASSNTGGITATMSATTTTTITGSSGNDIITTGSADLTTGSVNAGNGTDSLVTTADARIATSTLGGKYTGFETLNISSTQTIATAGLGGAHGLG